MFKYFIKCLLSFTICAAIIGGAAAALGAEYKLITGAEENILSYERLSDYEGKLTLGKFAFSLDLCIIEGAKEKIAQYMDNAVSYLPETAVGAGRCLRGIVKGLCY